MKKIVSFSILLSLVLVLFSCKKNPLAEDISSNEYVNKWIYDEMSIWYLWNDKLPSQLTYTASPDVFFDKLLYKYDAQSNPDGDRFSWIQNNYQELLNSLTGVSAGDIGFEYRAYYIVSGQPEVEFRVVYAKRGSDAEAKGIKRGQKIRAVDGTVINENNYRTILSGSGSKTLSRVHHVLNPESGEYSLQPMEDVTVQIMTQFAENPILLDSVYPIDNKRIGYLVYNFFARDKGDNSSEYDLQLMQTLHRLKEQEITELVLDLRYNSGGLVSSAVALGSALVKNNSTQNVMMEAKYNALIENRLRIQYGDDYFKTYFQNSIMQGDNQIALIPMLNLSTLYVLTGKNTASASELLINSLSPYMDNIILIGDKTYGKNVGSISIYKENDPNNKWGMQPIVVKFYNSLGNSDFSAGFSPQAENAIHEFDYPLVELGNLQEPLLNQAMQLITNNKEFSRNRLQPLERTKAAESTKMPGRYEMYDDIRLETIRKVIRNR